MRGIRKRPMLLVTPQYARGIDNGVGKVEVVAHKGQQLAQGHAVLEPVVADGLPKQVLAKVHDRRLVQIGTVEVLHRRVVRRILAQLREKRFVRLGASWNTVHGAEKAAVGAIVDDLHARHVLNAAPLLGKQLLLEIGLQQPPPGAGRRALAAGHHVAARVWRRLLLRPVGRRAAVQLCPPLALGAAGNAKLAHAHPVVVLVRHRRPQVASKACLEEWAPGFADLRGGAQAHVLLLAHVLRRAVCCQRPIMDHLVFG